MINLGVYISANRVVEKTTGVGKHTIGMIKSLYQNEVSIYQYLTDKHDLMIEPKSP